MFYINGLRALWEGGEKTYFYSVVLSGRDR